MKIVRKTLTYLYYDIEEAQSCPHYRHNGGHDGECALMSPDGDYEQTICQERHDRHYRSAIWSTTIGPVEQPHCPLAFDQYLADLDNVRGEKRNAGKEPNGTEATLPR
jgi:hypothetical protein